MQQLKGLTRTLLILTIINLVLAAPVAVLERPGVPSQKRWGSEDEGELPSPNIHGSNLPDYAPPPNPDFSHRLSEKAYTNRPPNTPGSPGLSGHVLPRASSADMWPQEAQPAGQPATPLELMSVVGSNSPPPPPPPVPSRPGPSGVHFCGPPGFSVNPDTLSSRGDQPTPPQTSGVESEMHLTPNSRPSIIDVVKEEPSEGRFSSPSGTSMNSDTLPATEPTGKQPMSGVVPKTHFLLNPTSITAKVWDKVVKESQLLGSMLAGSYVPSPPHPLPHSSPPGSSEGRFPDSEPLPTDFWDEFSKGLPVEWMPVAGSQTLPPPPPHLSQSTPPQNPGVYPETHYPSSPGSDPTGIWGEFEELLKGKIKPRMSDSDPVKILTPDILKFLRSRRDALTPLYGHLGQIQN